MTTPTLPTDNLLATTLRAIGDGVISCDRERRVVMLNDVAAALTGWTEAEALGQSINQVFVAVDEVTHEPVADVVEMVFRTGRIAALANHALLRRRDGSELPVDDSAAPMLDAAGAVQGVVLVFRDVTERRRAELNLELLAESGQVLGQERLREDILRTISQAVSRHFADFCVFDLVRRGGVVRRTVGLHRDAARQAVVDGLKQFVEAEQAGGAGAPEERPAIEAILLPVMTDEGYARLKLGEEQERYLREEIRPRSVLAVPVEANGANCGSMLFVRDTLAVPFGPADRLTAEDLGRRLGLALEHEALREQLATQQARLNAVVESLPVGLLMADRQGRVVLANREVERIFGHPILPVETVEEHAVYVAFHPNGRRVKGEEFPLPRAMAENRAIRDEEYLYERGDGRRVWVSLSAAPVVADDGSVLGGVVAIADVDAEHRSRELLERSDRRFRMLVERASVGINIGDAQGGLSYMNPMLLQLIGYTEEDFARGHVRWDELTPAEYAEADQNALRQLIQTGRAQPYEKAYRGKGGEMVPMLLGATMIPSLHEGGRDDIAVFFTDLSAQKRAEMALRQTEKLSAVGRLASSISHEINNPLEAVMNLLYIVQQAPELTRGTRDYLDSADRELHRVANVASQTLRFHRQSTGATTVEPEALLGEVLELYATRLADSGIDVERRYTPDVVVTCYEGDIRQVLNNLVANAADAMRVGGRLTLRTERAREWPEAAQEGRDGVAITVTDTGDGVPAEAEARIFDAFFTTKGIHGTGLGLWISKRIVHKHRGHLSMKTSRAAVEHGSAFRLWLPCELAETAREPWHEE